MNLQKVDSETLENWSDQFVDLVQRGIDAWKQAGELLYKMLLVDPSAKQLIINRCPDITAEILSRFEAIGMGSLHPKTLLNNSPGMRKLRSMPYSDQVRYLNEPVPVLVKKDGGTDTLLIEIRNLTADQAAQALSSSGVRTLEAQRAWLESRRSKRQPVKSAYHIRNGKVTFHADCEMTSREIAHLLAQMT